MIGSQPVRYCVAALFFLLGVVALNGIPNTEGFEYLRQAQTPLRWLLLLPPVLVLLAAYGMFRRLALGRYSMYALLALNLVVILLTVANSTLQWRWIIPSTIVAAATVYVHFESKSAPWRKPAQRRWLREGGFVAIYFAAVVLCVASAELVEGPRVKTLSGPVSVANP